MQLQQTSASVVVIYSIVIEGNTAFVMYDVEGFGDGPMQMISCSKSRRGPTAPTFAVCPVVVQTGHHGETVH